MAFLTKSAFAKHAGVSRQRISVMCKEGHLTVRPDGKLDTEDRTNKNYLEKTERAYGYKYTDKKGDAKQNKNKKNLPVEKNKSNNSEKSIMEKNREVPEESDENILEGIPDDLKLMTKHDLDRMKAAMKVMQDKLKHQKERGDLIDRMLIRKAFNELYQVDSEQFLQSSSVIAPRICQDIFETNDPEKLTKVSEMLDSDFYKIQNHIRRVFDKHLSIMEVEPIQEAAV